MRTVWIPLLIGLSTSLRSRAELQVEIAALHHQLWILRQRSKTRRRLRSSDRIFLDVAASAVGGLATRPRNRQTRDCFGLASPRVSYSSCVGL